MPLYGPDPEKFSISRPTVGLGRTPACCAKPSARAMSARASAKRGAVSCACRSRSVKAGAGSATPTPADSPKATSPEAAANSGLRLWVNTVFLLACDDGVRACARRSSAARRSFQSEVGIGLTHSGAPQDMLGARQVCANAALT